MEHDLTGKFNKVFVTGDIHGDVEDLADRVASMMATKDDLVIILGDCGLFYSCYYKGSEGRDTARRKYASKLPCTILCVQGNHEQPFAEMDAERVKIFDGEGYFKDGVYFLKNGTSFTVNGKSFLVIGGACSIDRNLRLESGFPWWENEELSQSEFDEIIKNTKGKSYDFVLTHTTPYDDMPVEAFIHFENKYSSGDRTERNLQIVKEQIEYDAWYAGHFHIDKVRDKLHLMYHFWERII